MSHTIHLLQDLISIPSVYPHEEQIADYLYQHLVEQGDSHVIRQRVSDTRSNIIAIKGPSDATYVHGLCGHLDTVPATAGWTRDPHDPSIVGDRVYGLGSYDMKGGVAAQIGAFLAHRPEHVRVQLVLTVDEEARAAGCEAYLSSGLSEGVRHLVISEPGFGHGVRGIVTGRSGWGWINITLTQDQCHFAHYDIQRDLAQLFAHITQYLNTLSRSEMSQGGRQFVYVRDAQIIGEGLSLPHSIRAQCDCSILDPDTGVTLAEQIRSHAQSLIDEQYPHVQLTVEFDPGASRPYAAYRSDVSSRYYRALASSVEEVTGMDAIPYYRSSVSDENILAAAGIAVLGIGPAGHGAHAPDEWVSASSVTQLETILTRYLDKVDKQ